MPAGFGESDHLVLDARTVPRAPTADRPTVECRFLEVPGDDLLQPFIRMGEIAGQLRRMGRPLIVGEPELAVAILPLQSCSGHRPSIDPWRGTRLEAFNCNPLCHKVFRQFN